MAVELSIAEIAFVFAMVSLGGLIQGSLGFGFAFTAAPALALVRPEAVPVTILLLFIPMAVLMALRERGSIRVRDFTWITVGRLPRTLVGAWILLAIPSNSLGIVFGLLILIGVIISTLGVNFEGGAARSFSGAPPRELWGQQRGLVVLLWRW